MNTNNIRLSKDELKRLRNIDFTKVKSVSTAEEEFTQKYGATGTPQRQEFESKAKAWYYGEILRDRRKQLGMTQKQ